MSWKHIVDLESRCKSCILMASVVVYAGISFYVPFRSQDYFFIIQTAHLLCCLPHSFDMRQLNLIINCGVLVKGAIIETTYFCYLKNQGYMFLSRV